MNESINRIKSLIDRYFGLKRQMVLKNGHLTDVKVNEEKLLVKLSNRDSRIEYLENELSRVQVLKSNRDRMIDALVAHSVEISGELEKIKEGISNDLKWPFGLFSVSRRLRLIQENIESFSNKLEVNPCEAIDYEDVPEKIELIQNQYMPPLVSDDAHAVNYDYDFVDIEGGARELKLDFPQAEWDSVQQSVLRDYGEGFMQYCFGGKIRLLGREDMVREVNKTGRFLAGLKKEVADRKCIVVGNGPSLNKHDFKLMRGQFMIGSNYIFMNHDKMGYYPDLITATNFLVVEQRLQDFLDIKVPKIFPFYMYNLVGPCKDVYYLNVNHLPEFSENANLWASTRSTVTFLNLQIAYFLGFEETYLIGVDNTYQQSTKREGKILVQEENDPNHFSPEYFKGLQWQSADPDNMAMVYGFAKQYFDKAGLKVFNAGIGGALEVFPRLDYKNALRGGKGRAVKIKDSKCERVVISINPDLQSFFGHYYQLDLNISKELAVRGDGFVVLCNKSIDLEVNSKFPFLIPCFSETSHALGLRNVGELDVEALFKQELQEGIEKIKQSFISVKYFEFFMYCGSYPHLRAVSDVIDNLNRKDSCRFRFHIHVFYPAFEKAFGRSTEAQGQDYFSEYKSSPKLLPYAGTEDFQVHLSGTHNVDIRYLPCSSTTFTDEEIEHYREGQSADFNVVCFPGNLRPEKGMAVTLDALFRINEDEEFSETQFIVRRFKKNDEEDEVDYYKCILRKGIEWVEGELSSGSFKTMVASADIVVIPYSKEAFGMRPSGLFADSILLEKPVLVEAGTFMARYVEAFGNGYVYKPNDGQDLVSKLKKMFSNVEQLRLACRLARVEWEGKNSWNKFYESLTS